MESDRERRVFKSYSCSSAFACRLSKAHKDAPWGMYVNGNHYEVPYWPGDSMSGMFGGNSNWRGPICESSPHGDSVSSLSNYPLGLATNFLLIESLQRFYQYYGDDLQVCKQLPNVVFGLKCPLQVECPTGSGDFMNLLSVAEEIQHRIIHIFGRDLEGKRAANGGAPKLDNDPHFRDYVHFHEVSSLRPHVCRFPLNFNSLNYVTVLPRGYWQWVRGVTSDRLVLQLP
jgi:hypothetical protein